ncbi:MAG: glycerate kinase, partial [Solirubrobacterales bacterium]|nr:glycerate kinase [Solirubrobacterales bacterium]
MPTLPRSILVAPDSFKGTLTAVEVAQAIGRGLEQRGRPVDLCPLADGGEGTLQVLVEALGGELRRAPAHDPLGRPIEAFFGLAEERRATVGLVESAQASGLDLLVPEELDPLAASTAGTGELILAARDAGAQRIYLGVGGSATTDGGSGAIKAIDKGGGLGDTSLMVLCDVRTPFEDAARVFGPQKGADETEVRRLTQRLHRLARGYKRDPRGRPMTGAAGGLSGGLWAELGAE